MKRVQAHWLHDLDLSAQSKNHVLFSFCILLREAEEDAHTPFNPWRGSSRSA